MKLNNRMKTEYKTPTCDVLSVEILHTLCVSGFEVTTEDYIINNPDKEIDW